MKACDLSASLLCCLFCSYLFLVFSNLLLSKIKNPLYLNYLCIYQASFSAQRCLTFPFRVYVHYNAVIVCIYITDFSLCFLHNFYSTHTPFVHSTSSFLFVLLKVKSTREKKTRGKVYFCLEQTFHSQAVSFSLREMLFTLSKRFRMGL